MSMTVNKSIGNDVSAAIAAAVNGDIDVQTFLQMVMSQRVNLVDEQLRVQVKAVQARNEQLVKLNEVLSKLNVFQAAIGGTGPGSKIDKWDDDKVRRYEIPLNDAIREAGIEDLGFKGRGQVTPREGEEQNGTVGHVVEGKTNMASCDTNRGQIESAIAKVKGLIDSESNSQQMEMFRLQSLNNKKNESVETLTNTQKKHTDSLSGIIQKF